MGIPIEETIAYRRRMQFALKALRDRGWNVSVFSPGSSINGKIINIWMVMLDQPENKWDVAVSGHREDLTRMEGYKRALAYHGLEIVTKEVEYNEPLGTH
jgi:hypothetical protein